MRQPAPFDFYDFREPFDGFFRLVKVCIGLTEQKHDVVVIRDSLIGLGQNINGTLEFFLFKITLAEDGLQVGIVRIGFQLSLKRGDRLAHMRQINRCPRQPAPRVEIIRVERKCRILCLPRFVMLFQLKIGIAEKDMRITHFRVELHRTLQCCYRFLVLSKQ